MAHDLSHVKKLKELLLSHWNAELFVAQKSQKKGIVGANILDVVILLEPVAHLFQRLLASLVVLAQLILGNC